MNVSIVTGASRGIGKAIAKKLAETTKVLLIATNKDALGQVCEEINRSGGTANFFSGDVKDAEFAKAVIAHARTLGFIQNLVLNAGISKSGAAASFPDSALRELFDVNFFGAVNFIKAALPVFVAPPGSGDSGAAGQNIILLAGTAGIQGYSQMSGYCATKHALVGLARGLAAEVGHKGVNIYPVCPGPTDTDMTAAIINLLAKKMTVDEARAKIAKGSGLPRLLTPEDVAETIDAIIGKRLVVPNGEPVSVSPRPDCVGAPPV